MTMHVGTGRGPGHLNRLWLLAGGAAPVPVSGDATALAVRDATALNAVDGNGWTADLTFKGMAAGGVLDMAGARAVSVNVTRKGFNNAGVATTFSETIQGAAALRNIAPGHLTQQNRASGSDVITSVILRRRLYAGGVDQITSATIPAGAYTVGGTPSRVSSVAAPANNSGYAVPDPLYGFLVPHHQVRTADFRFEMVVAHAEARYGQQVACVEFRVRDVDTQTDQGISVKVGTPELSQLQTQGPKVECFGATIPISSLTQAVEYEVYAIIYPWVAAQAYDTRTLGLPYATTTIDPDQRAIRFICDKAGAYQTAVAYVRAGASSGQVNNSALPFPHISGAAIALRNHNNGKTGLEQRNNCGGSTIYLMEDSPGAGAQYDTTGGSFGSFYSDAVAGIKAWTTITVDPAATGVVKIRNGATGVGMGLAGMTKFVFTPKFILESQVRQNSSNDQIIFDNGNGGAPVWLDGGNFGFTFAQPAQWQFLYRHNGFIYATNCTFGTNCHPNNRVTLLLGCVHAAPISSSLFCGVAVGNRFNAGIDKGTNNAGSAVSAFVGWNELFKCGGAGYGRPAWGKTMTGFAFVSNVVEVRDSAEPTLQLWADSNGENIDNLLFFHNTLVGGRMNGMYTASGISATGMVKRGDEANNISSVWNTKTETFRYAAEGGSDMNLRTGNWAWVNGVNRRGCIVTSGDSTGGNAYNTNTWAGEVQPPKSRITATVLFADDKSGLGPGAVSGIGTGSGSYRLTGSAATNHAIGAVEQLWGMLRFDLDGNLRAQDGSGAVGAYERA